MSQPIKYYENKEAIKFELYNDIIAEKKEQLKKLDKAYKDNVDTFINKQEQVLNRPKTKSVCQNVMEFLFK